MTQDDKTMVRSLTRQTLSRHRNLNQRDPSPQDPLRTSETQRLIERWTQNSTEGATSQRNSISYI